MIDLYCITNGTSHDTVEGLEVPQGISIHVTLAQSHVVHSASFQALPSALKALLTEDTKGTDLLIIAAFDCTYKLGYTGAV